MVARLPPHRRQPLVRLAVPDAARADAPGDGGIRDDGARLPHRRRRRRRPDRARRRSDRHRRPAEARGGAQRRAPAGGQRMVRPHPLQPAQRQGAECRRAGHAPAARKPALGHDPRDDLTGHVLAQEDWEVVRFPAIAEANETYRIETLAGPLAFSRRPGEALHPARESLAMLAQIRRTIGEYPPDTSFRGSPASTSRPRRRSAAA